MDLSPRPRTPIYTDLLIIGGGPAGAAAALEARRANIEAIVIDRARFPRDKTCGDGLTPRAIAQLQHFGLATLFTDLYTSQGLALHGFGADRRIPWDPRFSPAVGSVCPRTILDEALLNAALAWGTDVMDGVKAVAPIVYDGRVEAVVAEVAGEPTPIFCRRLIVAEGVSGTIAAQLGVRWHRESVFGIAARGYATSPRADDPWIHSHVELRDEQGQLQPGYGWIFPTGAQEGLVNIGCGALQTASRPAKVNTKKLLNTYYRQVEAEWGLGQLTDVSSALLPMGGAVTGVAGRNWVAVGDAAALVNPLNGEGIDYALESGRAAVEMMAMEVSPSRMDLTNRWPKWLEQQYGAAFSLARRAAKLLTYPDVLPTVAPWAMKSFLMPVAARLMGNLVTPQDRDVVARAWRAAGAVTRSHLTDEAPLWGPREF